jgi:cytochrome b561
MNQSSKETMIKSKWHIITRFLHGLIAVGIIAQLLSSQFMVPPDELNDATAVQQFSWESHEVLGLITVAAILFHWLWIFFPRSDVSFFRLFPWNKAGIKTVKADVSHFIQNRTIPDMQQENGLSSFIHGLGFLVATLMAASGFALYLVIDWGDGAGSNSFETVVSIHQLFASIMWVYLIGHVGAAFWHEYKGEKIIQAIFSR